MCSGGQPALATEANTVQTAETQAALRFERKLDLIPDNEFGPLNQPVRERPDFYANSQGDTLPATGYRYMDSRYAKRTMQTRTAPGSYFGFERFETGAAARDRYQIFFVEGNPESWSDARLRGQLDTLQLFDQQGKANTHGA